MRKLATAIVALALAGLGWLAASVLGGPADRVESAAEPFELTVPAPPAGRGPKRPDGRPAPRAIRIPFADSVAVGSPSDGRLVRGVKMPMFGPDHFTWDPARRTVPNRGWRRYGTFDTVTVTLRVLRALRRANSNAPRIAIGDLSRPRGGDFGRKFAGLGLGHASHQNGLDVDIYYPRVDGRETAPTHPRQINRALSQELVDRLVGAGAVAVFVGPRTGLRGPENVVMPLVHHDDHIHVRWPE